MTLVTQNWKGAASVGEIDNGPFSFSMFIFILKSSKPLANTLFAQPLRYDQNDKWFDYPCVFRNEYTGTM